MKNEEKFNKLIEEIHDFVNVYDIDDLSEEIYNQLGKAIVCELNPDRHRWFEVSTNVYKVYDKYLGINHVSNVFSESMGIDDCGVELEAFEMEEVQTVTYKAKKD